MVRQDHLESLADPDLTNEELIGNRAVVNFIQDFLGTIRPNLKGQIEDIKREQAGLKPEHLLEGDPYMEISGDLDEARDLTTVN